MRRPLALATVNAEAGLLRLARRTSPAVALALLLASCAAPAATPSPAMQASPSSAPQVTPAATAAGPVASPSAPAATPSTPGVLAIACDASGSHIDVPAVRAQPDGVHLEARTGDGRPAQVDIGLPDEGTVGGLDGSATLDLGPGSYGLRCIQPFDLPWVPFRIVDPGHFYVSPELGCPDHTGTTSDGSEIQAVPTEAAISFLRTRMLLEATDVLEPAGYRDRSGGRIRIVRRGQVIATVLLGRAGNELVVVAQEHCTGLTLWRP